MPAAVDGLALGLLEAEVGMVQARAMARLARPPRALAGSATQAMRRAGVRGRRRLQALLQSLQA